jgi:hypothetical protein
MPAFGGSLTRRFAPSSPTSTRWSPELQAAGRDAGKLKR